MKFAAAPLDLPARRWLAAGTALGAVLLAGAAAMWAAGLNPGAQFPLYLAIPLGAQLGMRYAGAPVAYELDGTHLVVLRRHRRAKRFAIIGQPRGFAQASLLRHRSLRAGEYYGCRWARDTRRWNTEADLFPEARAVYVATTDLDRAVVVPVERDRAVLVTPVDPDTFLSAVRLQLHG